MRCSKLCTPLTLLGEYWVDRIVAAGAVSTLHFLHYHLLTCCRYSDLRWTILRRCVFDSARYLSLSANGIDSLIPHFFFALLSFHPFPEMWSFYWLLRILP